MMASHFCVGNSSIGDTNWMPALLTSMSIPPNAPTAVSTIAAISSGSIMFAATAVTTGDLLRGVRFFKGGATTNSVVMRSRTHTVRYIEALHRFDLKPEY